MSLGGRYAIWLEAVRSLLALPATRFPREDVLLLFNDTFELGNVTWNWRNADGTYGTEIRDPIDRWTGEELPIGWAMELQQLHPLLVWFRASGSTLPMSIGRVPRRLASPAGLALIRDELGHRGLEQQLSVPYHLGPDGYRAFVLARGAEDFSGEDMELTRRIQPLLELLQQREIAGQAGAWAAGDPEELSAREDEVLGLLAQGLTAESIGRRLAISPRTVHRHLSRIYDKLGVTDRGQALLRAQALGLLTPWADPVRAARRPPMIRLTVRPGGDHMTVERNDHLPALGSA